MRPIKLTLEGFTAYREFTVVDFDGADLFVLTGPTGSGKSSLIDAITFALYGSVARYQNPNLVHPVVSQGKVEAKVRFDFAIGERKYTAVRVVRKTPRGGATTKEARLELDGHLVAGAADEITRAVQEILGLSFEQFTTCAVLPQGDFARFLHEKPAQRQDLLTKLLGVDIYERMGNLARSRESAAKQRAQLQAEELEQIRDATFDAHKKAARRVRELKELLEEVERVTPEVEALEKEFERARQSAEKLEMEAQLLEKVSVPEGVSALAGRIDDARDQQQKAREAREAADDAVVAAEVEAAKRPSPTELDKALRAFDEQETRRAGSDDAKAELDEARKRREEAKAEQVSAELEVDQAREEVDRVRRKLSAHDLASHLHKGDTCPVCQQTLAATPSVTMPPALADTERALEAKEEGLKKRQRAFRTTEKRATLAEERFRASGAELEALSATIAQSASKESVLEQLAVALDASTALDDRRVAARTAREDENRALEQVEALSKEESTLWRRFDTLRDAAAALGPPPTDRDNMVSAWEELSQWAGELEKQKLADGLEAAALATTAVDARKEAFAKLDRQARDIDVALGKKHPRDTVVSLLAEATQEEKRIADAIDRAALVRARLEADKEAARVAGALGQHLRATGFERWLLEAAFARLAAGATLILQELSSGQYSFEYDEKLNFEVVDHRNADERRSARTLSGGETFLASLALALTLAEQTADLAASGAARLESLFLDEGFGTLDDDTLEVVAAAIEDLGAKGRVVGLVTHQQSLAEKIPVQFRVSKGPVTATVEKVTT